MSLDDAFKALRDTTSAEVAGIDVQSAVAFTTRRRRGILMRARAWVPAAAAALVALFVWQDIAAARTVTIVANSGRITVDGAEHELSGESRWSRPFVVRSAEQPITLRGRGWTSELATEATLRVADEASLERGAVRVDGELTVHAVAAIEVNGRAAIWRLEDMDMRKRVLLGAAGVALVAVYAGHATINGSSFVAPAAAIVDAKGVARPVDPGALDRAADDNSRHDQGNDIAVSHRAASGDTAKATGGYWDEAHKLVRFRIAGEVFDAATGEPVKSFDVAVLPLGTAFSSTLKQTRGVSDASNGHFIIDPLSLGIWQVTVSARGYAPSRQTVPLTAVADDPYLVVPLTAGARVTGLVVDTRGEPVEGATVAAGSADGATTDAKGAFVLTRLPEDSAFTVTATHQRYGAASLPNVRVAEGETEHITITLSGILKVSGHVFRGPDHDAVARAVVKSGEVTALTDTTGAYSLFIPLDKHPPVRVIDGNVELVSYAEGRSAEPITWVTAKTHVAELVKDFELAMENGRIVGRISNADGSPVAGAQIEVQNTMGWGSRHHNTFPASTTTDTDGRYSIPDVPAHAAYQLALVQEGSSKILGTVTMDAPSEVDGSYTIAGETLHGRFVDAKSNAPFLLPGRGCNHIGVVRVGETAAHIARCFDDGTFEVTDLPSGRYRVVHIGMFVDSMQVGDAEADVPGSPIDVAITGERATTYTVRVTTSDGAFVAEPMLRYVTGKTVITSSLSVGDEGTATFSVSAAQPSVFIDAPGYTPASIDLGNTASVIDVRLTRVR